MRIQRTFVLCVLGVASAGTGNGEEPGFNPRVVLRMPMRPIVDASFVDADKATDAIVAENELVLGVVLNGQARAYPINMITGPRREIINDTLGGRAIAATW